MDFTPQRSMTLLLDYWLRITNYCGLICVNAPTYDCVIIPLDYWLRNWFPQLRNPWFFSHIILLVSLDLF